MSKIHTSIVSAAHGYTRNDDTPWIMDQSASIYGKLVHYLSGGGMRTFGRTIRQERVRRLHRRFLIWTGVLAFFWVVFYFA